MNEFLAKAIALVYTHVKSRLEKTDTHVTFDVDEVYIVWFCKTLQNWKALLSTTLPDGMYYEVTYNGDKHEAYIDAYKKFENVVVPDDDQLQETIEVRPAAKVQHGRGVQIGHGNTQSNVFG